MSVCAIIPARGGSKGIPRKNLRLLGGRPLVAWAIEAGQQAKLVDRVIVSTEDAEIADVSRSYGAEVIDRPAELATDDASTDSVLMHAAGVAWGPGWGSGAAPWAGRLGREVSAEELVVLLQPTVPLRPPGLVDACIRHLQDEDADCVLTGHELHFVWSRHDMGYPGGRAVWGCNAPRRPPRQRMALRERRWAEDGAVYVTRASVLASSGARLAGRQVLHLTQPGLPDIDEETDLLLAEALLSMPLWRRRLEVAA